LIGTGPEVAEGVQEGATGSAGQVGGLPAVIRLSVNEDSVLCADKPLPWSVGLGEEGIAEALIQTQTIGAAAPAGSAVHTTLPEGESVGGHGGHARIA